MRIEQQNMFTGEFEVVRDDVAEAEFEVKMYWLSLEPIRCEACHQAMIEPQWGKNYDVEDDGVDEYFYHHCWNCSFEQYVNRRGEDITDLIEKNDRRRKEREEYEKLYDRRLV